MFQLKISAVFFIALLTVMGVSYVLVDGEVTEGVLIDEASELGNASNMIVLAQHEAESALNLLSKRVASDDRLLLYMSENLNQIRSQLPSAEERARLPERERSSAFETVIRGTRRRGDIEQRLLQVQREINERTLEHEIRDFLAEHGEQQLTLEEATG